MDGCDRGRYRRITNNKLETLGLFLRQVVRDKNSFKIINCKNWTKHFPSYMHSTEGRDINKYSSAPHAINLPIRTKSQVLSALSCIAFNSNVNYISLCQVKIIWLYPSSTGQAL